MRARGKLNGINPRHDAETASPAHDHPAGATSKTEGSQCRLTAGQPVDAVHEVPDVDQHHRRGGSEHPIPHATRVMANQSTQRGRCGQVDRQPQPGRKRPVVVPPAHTGHRNQTHCEPAERQARCWPQHTCRDAAQQDCRHDCHAAATRRHHDMAAPFAGMIEQAAVQGITPQQPGSQPRNQQVQHAPQPRHQTTA